MTDQATPLPSGSAPNWKLPEILDVQIAVSDFVPRQPRNFSTELRPVRNAVEIIITLEKPAPIRALGPVLHVGDVTLTESEAVDKEGKQLRFWAFDQAKLQANSPNHTRMAANCGKSTTEIEVHI